MSCLFASMDYNSHLKCNSKSILEKKDQHFSCGPFLLFITHETFIDVPPFQENSPVLKKSWLRACTGPKIQSVIDYRFRSQENNM